MGKSKRSKVSWRAVNIKDVDNFLEDQRLQERLGTNFASKPDHELFVVDTEPTSEKALKIKDRRPRNLSKAQRKKLVLEEKPRCFQSLENISKVPDPSGKRNHVKPVTLSQQTIAKKIRRGVYKKKFELATKSRKAAMDAKAQMKMVRTDFSTDLWDDEKAAPKKKTHPTSEWLTLDTKNCNILDIKPKKPTRKNPNRPPIDLPHPGTSYNPTYKAHQELLKDVVVDELKNIKEDKHLDRVTSKMFRRVTRKTLEAEQLEQLKEGLNDDDKNNDNNDDDGDFKPINPPVENRKKDLKKRRNMKEHNMQKGKAKEEAVEKRKLADIYKLRFLEKSIVKKDTLQGAKRLARAVKKVTMKKVPQISAKPFKEPPAVFTMANDLSGNLRNLKPQGSTLSDQFVSLQRRGLTSVSAPRTLRKKATKRYKLATHRLPWEQLEKPVKTKKQK